jgi:hypothetical protein
MAYGDCKPPNYLAATTTMESNTGLNRVQARW